MNTYLNNSYPRVKQKEKKPLETETRSLFNQQFYSFLDNPINIKKQALEDLFVQMVYDGNDKERDNFFRYLDLYIGYSIFFNKKTLEVSRKHEALKCKYSTRTTDRNRALAKKLGLVEIYNSRQEQERHKNKISKTNIQRFKEILKELKKYLPQKHALLIFLFASLGLTNITRGEHINIYGKYKSDSITSKGNIVRYGSGVTKQPKVFNCLPRFEILSGESHASAASIARDKCLDYIPKKTPPIPLTPPYSDDEQDWITENEYMVAMQYKNKSSDYWVTLKHDFWALKEKKRLIMNKKADFQRYKKTPEELAESRDLLRREKELRRKLKN